LPASGCEMMAKVRRFAASAAGVPGSSVAVALMKLGVAANTLLGQDRRADRTRPPGVDLQREP